MKTAINIIILILLTTTVGCKKTANFHVKIVNPATGEGYANTTFYVKSEKTGADGEIIKTEATGLTNENGEAVVSSLKISNAKSYYVVPENIENVCYINDVKIYYTDRMTNPNPHFIFEIAPCAQLKMKVKNINCLGESDIISISMTNTVNSLSPNPWILNGCADYETVTTNVPMGLYNVTWTVTKNNITTNHSDSFYLDENEYKYYVIEY